MNNDVYLEDIVDEVRNAEKIDEEFIDDPMFLFGESNYQLIFRCGYSADQIAAIINKTYNDNGDPDSHITRNSIEYSVLYYIGSLFKQSFKKTISKS